MKENKIIYVLYDWGTEQRIITTYAKIKALAKIGELALSGECVDDLKIIEIDLSEVED